MRIIVRDIFRTYFPKYYQTYQSLSVQRKEQLFLSNKLANNDEIQMQKQVPQQLLGRKPSTSKQKKSGNPQINKSKQDRISTKNICSWTQQQVGDMGSMSELQKQRVDQVLCEGLRWQVERYIDQHRFHRSCNNSYTTQDVIEQVRQKLVLCLRQSPSTTTAKPHRPTQPSRSSTTAAQQPSAHLVQQHLYKLSLYLNRQTNRQIFSVYQHILMSSSKSGISYQTLSKRLKTDIINVSHYCCKLKKMRFVDWQHRKQGIIVFPRLRDIILLKIQRDSQLNRVKLTNDNATHSFNYSKSFIFSQLTLNENILINVSSASSLLQGGMTNEQIKFKIMKHAQNKMVRRTVQGMKNIQKNAERQGKVFEFKYKKQTQIMVKELDRKRVQNSGIIELTQKCKQFLNNMQDMKAVQVQQNEEKQELSKTVRNRRLVGQQLLLQVINTKLTDYISSIGIKQSKRQCTPLKLNRYIRILNYLQQQGPESEYQLRRHIIEVQKQMQNSQQNGIIHKRSVIGILEGLKKIQLIQQVDTFYYPKWIQGIKRRQRPQVKKNLNQLEEQLDGLYDYQKNGNKKIKRDNSSGRELSKIRNRQVKLTIPNEKIRMITKKQHLTQIFTQLLNIAFQKALKRILRKGFHRIMYTHRKRQSIPNFIPQKNIFHLLDDEFGLLDQNKVQEHATTLEGFISQIDLFVKDHGEKIQNFPQIQYQVVKFVRRNPNKNADSLRTKYGKNWRQKFQPLQNQRVIKISEEGYQTLQNFQQYLV